MLSSFFNDIVIVCTVAIIVGQHIRSDVQELVSSKKEEVTQAYNEANLSFDDEAIRKQLDSVNSYKCEGLKAYPIMFFSIVLFSLLLNIICGGFEIIESKDYQNILGWLKVLTEIMTFICLGFYGWQIHKIKASAKKQIKECETVLTGLSFATKSTPNK